MRKILLLCVVGLLAGCQSEPAPSGEADKAQMVDGSVEAVEQDIAANQADPVTPDGTKVDIAAVQAAFDTSCPDTVIQNASCEPGASPTEFACDYALKGDNIFSMKQTTIAEDGESWKLTSIPNHCTKQ